MNYITPYNPEWAQRFQDIRQALTPVLPSGCKFHHVGSTSIPGMPAKDIIDIDVECPSGSMQAVIECLAPLGYEHQGDLGIRGREAFRIIPDSQAAALPAHHLYTCETATSELLRHLLFRDYLIANPARAAWLANEKASADAKASSRADYIENKNAAYARIVAEASEWASQPRS